MEARRRESRDVGKAEGKYGYKQCGFKQGGRKVGMKARRRESRDVGKA
jgi:hypothetical protein